MRHKSARNLVAVGPQAVDREPLAVEFLDHAEAEAEFLDADERRLWLLTPVGALDQAADVEGLKALARAVDQKQLALGGEGPARDHGVVGALSL